MDSTPIGIRRFARATAWNCCGRWSLTPRPRDARGLPSARCPNPPAGRAGADRMPIAWKQRYLFVFHNLLTQQVGSASIFPDNPRVRTSTRWLRSVAAIVALLGFAQSPVATGQPQSLVGHAKRHAVVAADAVWHGALDLVVYAFGLIGVAYRFGGESPDDGLDCSGLVRHVVQQITGVTLPRSSKDMSRIGGSVHKTDLAPGDLVFFNTR